VTSLLAAVALAAALVAAQTPGAQRDQAPAPGPTAAPPVAPEPSRGLAGYQGSDGCAACHEAEFASWVATPHARTVHEATAEEKELLGRSLLCGDHEATLVLGERHARRYLVPAEGKAGMHLLLPCRYDVDAAEWVNLHETDWRASTFERGCGGCHATGFSSDDFTSRELRVGCEACHGPGARHGDHADRGAMVSIPALTPAREAGICAACHLQGGTSRSTGLNYPRNIAAGDDPFTDYRFDWAILDEEPAEAANPIDAHQKILIRDLVKGGAAGSAAGLRCTSCHAIHGDGHTGHASLSRVEFCYLCHERNDFSLKEYSQSCHVCEF